MIIIIIMVQSALVCAVHGILTTDAAFHMVVAIITKTVYIVPQDVLQLVGLAQISRHMQVILAQAQLPQIAHGHAMQDMRSPGQHA